MSDIIFLAGDKSVRPNAPTPTAPQPQRRAFVASVLECAAKEKIWSH